MYPDPAPSRASLIGAAPPEDPELSRTAGEHRLHAMDALRAVMMLLGLLLHSAVSYGEIPYGPNWPYKDQSTSPLADLLVVIIHVFRMPIFYVMAGFFAALLYYRRGAAGFLSNRAVRILVPFVVGWIVLIPLTITGFSFALAARESSIREGLAVVWAGVSQGRGLYADTTAHLWFLYDLLIFYAVWVALVPLAGRLPASWRRAGLQFFGALLRSRGRPLWFAVPTALTLQLMPAGSLGPSTSFAPSPRVLLAYGVFFGFGWLLYLRRDLLFTFRRRAWRQIGLALLLMPIHLKAVELTIAALPARNPGSHLVALTTDALIVWLLVFGITGLFLRYLDRPFPVVRYGVDASYWLYLIHLPFTIWIPGMLSGLAWPAWLKVSAVLAIAAPIWIASYDLCVRNTLIGRVLNGRRHPRGLPARRRPGEGAPLSTEPDPRGA
jgi:fucose 4-O-acetylase-like acetyltransferase